jgi:hypothetical protein
MLLPPPLVAVDQSTHFSYNLHVHLYSGTFNKHMFRRTLRHIALIREGAGVAIICMACMLMQSKLASQAGLQMLR